jgi:hypothetical protein
MGDNFGGRAMDDTPCQDFFLTPSQTRHRRYEALRAFFLEHRPLPEIARVFGYRYGTLRNLVAEFRAQCRAGQVPPFLPARLAGGLASGGRHSRRPRRTRRP